MGVRGSGEPGLWSRESVGAGGTVPLGFGGVGCKKQPHESLYFRARLKKQTLVSKHM